MLFHQFMVPKLKYLYGPVSSWRLGSSLGVDPIGTEAKVCPYDCPYCQLGKEGKVSIERKIFVKTEDIEAELAYFDSISVDSITISGMGDPILAKNLGEIIQMLQKRRPEPVTILTNGVLLHLPEVKRDLMKADKVSLKLDAATEKTFRKIDHPHKELTLGATIENFKNFARDYQGELSLQMMFLKINKEEAPQMAQIARELGIRKVEINTPLRQSPMVPLSKEEIETIRSYFNGFDVSAVYDSEKKKVSPLDAAAAHTRHPEYR